MPAAELPAAGAAAAALPGAGRTDRLEDVVVERATVAGCSLL
jgi:hypothetical protein